MNIQRILVVTCNYLISLLQSVNQVSLNMSNKQENSLLEDKHIPNGDEVAKHLLKLDQLSEFGLNFFTDETNDLKSEALPSMLLNEVSSSHSSSVSRERGQNVHFCTFHDYTSSSTFPTISPKHDNTELIEVFPLTEDILIATSISNNTTEKSSAIFSAADPVESEDFTAETSKLYVESSDATKFHCTNLSHEKKIIYSKSNLENKLPVVDSKFPNSKISNEIKFVTDVVGEEPVLYDNTELENKINDTLLDMLQKKIGTSTCNAPYYFRLVLYLLLRILTILFITEQLSLISVQTVKLIKSA